MVHGRTLPRDLFTSCVYLGRRKLRYQFQYFMQALTRPPAEIDTRSGPDQGALHTTSDIEGGFVDRTVAMVRAGTLPRDLFTSCFIWARKKPRHQFQYFRQALTIRAAEIGINL